MPLVGLNSRQHILHMSKIMVHCYYTDETINQFSIGYMINPSLNCNKVFRVKVEKFWSSTFHSRTIETIRDYLKNNNTCVMALITIYENNGLNAKKVYIVLSCAVYSLIESYVFIDYITYQSKT